MKNNKKLFLFGVVFVVVAILFIGIVSFILSNLNSDNINSNVQNIKIYYYDKINNNLSYEQKTLTLEKENFLDIIFKEMKSSPKSSNLSSTVPENLTILNHTLVDYNLDINLSSDYNSLSNVEKLLFRSSLVLTTIETSFVNNVKIFVDGVEQKYNNNNSYLNRNNIILNPTISPDKIEREKVTLYFSNENNKLVEESRNIEVKQNKSMELYIVEELINGSKYKNNINTIPYETKIRNIKTENNICYVDLSLDFISKMSGNKTYETLAIYSIVNSLTNLDGINKVQFLIDGEKLKLPEDSIDISKPLGRYSNIIEDKKIIGVD